MNTHSRSSIAATLLLVATNLLAQGRASCQNGPGAAFGVTAYQCANCGFKQGKDGRPTYLFYAELVILQTIDGSATHVGDVVEAVNGKPITTNDGAEQFAYPPGGQNEMTVRRGRDRHVLRFTLPAPSPECESPSHPASPEVRAIADPVAKDQIRLPNAGAVAGVQSGPLIFVDGVRVTGPSYTEFGPADTGPTGGYGFGVSCTPSCTAATAKEGKTSFTYYKYDGYPPIIAIRKGGPAEAAGLKVGDLVTKVDGHSVLEEDGAVRLWSVHRKDSIHLTVLRDGKEIGYLIKVR